MNPIRKMQMDLMRKNEVIAELRLALRDLAAYASSEKYRATEADPIPTMNPADVVNRVRDWEHRVGDIELNGRAVTDWELTSQAAQVLELTLNAKAKRGGPVVVNRCHQVGPDEFNVCVSGEQDGTPFTGWLDMMAIHELVAWTSPEVAAKTDYEQIALDGDWSAVRDSRPESQKRIFREHVLTLL